MRPLPQGAWACDVHTHLVDLLRDAAPGSIAAFDWDDTVAYGDLSIELMRHFDRTRQTTHERDYFAVLASHGREAAYPLPALWLAGLDPDATAALAREVVDDALAKGRVAMRPDVCHLIEAMAARHWQVWVVSASPQALVVDIAARVGIPREQVLGMELALGPDGRYVAQLASTATVGEGKASALKSRIGSQLLLAAGDSPSDAPMLRMATHALLIDGHHPGLRREANRRGWWIQEGWPHTDPEPRVYNEDS